MFPVSNVDKALFLLDNATDFRKFVQQWRILSPKEKIDFAKLCSPQQYTHILYERYHSAKRIDKEREIIQIITRLQRERLNPNANEEKVITYKYNTFHSESVLLDLETMNQQIGTERQKLIIDHIPKSPELHECIETLRNAFNLNHPYKQFIEMITNFFLSDADIFHLFKVAEKEPGEFGNLLRTAIRDLYYENWEVSSLNKRKNPEVYSQLQKVEYVINRVTNCLNNTHSANQSESLTNELLNILNRYIEKKNEIQRTGSTKLPHYHHFCETLDELVERLNGQIPFDIPTNYYQGAYVSNQPTTSYGDFGIALEEKVHFKYGIEAVTKNEFLVNGEYDEGKVGWIGFTNPISILKEKNREAKKLSCVYVVIPDDMDQIPEKLVPFTQRNQFLKNSEFFLELQILRELHQGRLPKHVADFIEINP